MKKFLAFTLAETLIVMGVIGIVSALTLPNLNSSTGDKEKVAKVKKIYQNLNDAFTRAEAVYGPFDEWFVNDTSNSEKAKRASERISEFMKLQKFCGNVSNQGCWTTGNMSFLNDVNTGWNDGMIDTSSRYYKFKTSDGTSFAVSFMNKDEKDFIFILVDIDGVNKGKYILGKDIFAFSNKFDGINIRPAYADKMGDDSAVKDYIINVGEGAALWILNNDNMDYLKADGTTGKCPDGNVLSWSNTSCK